jgi:hypothetical protein
MNLFKRITNLDLMNEIIFLHNKLDLYYNKNDKKCCDCKEKEITVYNELKDFVEYKLDNIQNDINKLGKEQIIYEVPKIFDIYKQDIITTMEMVITEMKDRQENELLQFIQSDISLLQQKCQVLIDEISQFKDN